MGMRGRPLVTAAAVVALLSGGATGAAGQQPGAPEGAVVALITGSTGGLGREVARALAADGAHVIVHGRNVERGNELVAEIQASGKGSARFIAADLASFAEVRILAETVLRDYQRLDLLVNNAGIWMEDADGRKVTGDGHEVTFQVNYLSGFLLTRMLLPLLEASAPARVVNVSSVAQRPVDFDDPSMASGYSAGAAYGQSKLAQILFTVDLAEELAGTGVVAAALHPATMMDTDMVLERGARPRATVEEGMAAVLHVVRSPAVESGSYFRGQEPARAHAQAYDAAARERLRELSYRLTDAPRHR